MRRRLTPPDARVRAVERVCRKHHQGSTETTEGTILMKHPLRTLAPLTAPGSYPGPDSLRIR